MGGFLRGLGCSVVLSGALLGSAMAADMPTKAPAAVPYVAGPWLQLFGGFVVAPDSAYGYAGAVAAINHNLNQDGWLFRAAGGAGHYKYNIVPGVSNGVDFQTAEVMIGYQAFFGSTRITGYVGPNVEDHHNDVDPLATINGTKWGIKGQGEILTPIGQSAYLYGLGTYSSVWNNYFVMGKVGFNLSPVISVGPEAVALGNDRFDAVRAGAFIGFNFTPSTDIILSSGYSWDERRNSLNDHSGAYGTIHVRTTF
jgi:hypothetical protein